MNKALTLTALVLAAVSSQATANTFTPKFSDYPIVGTQYNVDAAANTYFKTNYGITIDNAYLYIDSRDTFDQRGISTGFKEANGQANQTAKITFWDQTDYVNLDFWTILGTTYKAFDSTGNIISSVFKSGGQEGQINFTGGGSLISYITFTATGGYGQVSGLTYSYDGKTDGNNDFINPPSSVPLPAALPLMLSGLGILGFASRRRKETA